MNDSNSIKGEIKTLCFVWKMATGEHKKIVCVLLLALLSGALPAVAAWAVKNILNNPGVIKGNFLNEGSVLLALSCVTLGVFLKTVSSLIMGRAMPGIKRNIEVTCVKKISRLPHDYVLEKMDNRSMLSFSVESGMLAALVPMVYHAFIQAPVTVLGFTGLLLFISPVLTVACLLLILTIVLGSVLFRKTLKKINTVIYDRAADLHQYFVEWLSGYRIFTASGTIRYMENRLLDVVENAATLRKKMALVGAFQSLATEIITILAAVFFLWAATRNSAVFHLPGIGEWILFPAAILFIRQEALKIIYGYLQLSKTESAAKRIMDIISRAERRSDDGEVVANNIHSLTVSNLSFGYAGAGKKIFDDADVTFKSGQINTLVGRSGSGKTTFINLCLRLILPDSGSIFYNDTDLRTLRESTLRDCVALVEQEPFILEGTLSENIFLGRTENKKDVLELLRLFDMTHLAENETELFDVKIGKNGRILSSGEKQRIAIIRALATQADVIFLDEVTSNLDFGNAQKIINSLKAIAKNKLIICVSHDILLIKESPVSYEIEQEKIKCVKQ